MRGVLLGVGLAGCLVGIAQAQVVKGPDWDMVRTEDMILRAYPVRAADQGIDGSVLLQCKVAVTGRLEDCEILSESPADFGFGAAAVAVAQNKFRMTPKTVDGKPVGGAIVRIPMEFRRPG